MNEAAACWARYLSLMAASRDCARDLRHRRTLIREAYGWLDAFFDAVDREVARTFRSAGC